MGSTLTAWLNQPFSSDQSAEKWALFVGFIMVIAFLWWHVMFYITGEIE